MRNRRPIIYDQYGKPVASLSYTFEAGNNYNRFGDTLPRHYVNSAQDTDKLLNASAWKQIMSSARYLFANAPILRGALTEQCTFSFPLTAQYVGTDRKWGRKAEEWLTNWKTIRNIKGPAFSGDMVSRLRLIGRKVDGDIGTILTYHGDNKYPAIQLVRAHRIGDRESGGRLTDLKKGRYRGNRICNGIIINKQGRTIAYRILGEKADEDQDVSAFNMFLSFRPDYPDLYRGISEMLASISDFDDVKRLREYEMRAQHIQSSYAIVEKNEEGEAPPGSDNIIAPSATATTSGHASGQYYRMYDGGIHQYFKSVNPGNGIELMRPDRPGEGSQRFEDRIISSALYGIEWDPNFALAIKEPGGAWARTILEKIRRCVAGNQKIEAAAQRREDNYAIAVAIKDGMLSEPSDGDFYSWEYQTPARVTADTGNEESAKREAYKLGLENLKELTGEKGRFWEEHREQRMIEVRDLLTRAKQLQSEFPEISLDMAITLMEQHNPNSPQSQSTQPETKEA